MTPAPQQGDLRETPLPALLLSLEAERATGLLTLERGAVRKQVELREGAPVLASSSRPSESLAQHLRAAGALDAEAAERLAARAAERGTREAAAALELRLLGPRELLAALRGHARALLLECFAWPEGRFGLEPHEAGGAAAAAARVDVVELILDGLATRWSPERLLEAVGPLLTRRWVLADGAGALRERLARRSGTAALLAGLDGQAPLARALGGAGDPVALAALWLLHARNALCEPPRAAEAEANAVPPPNAAASPAEGEVEFEIVVAGGGGAGPAVGADAAAGASAPRAGAADSDGAEALRREIQEKLARLDELSHYELLGLGPDARPGAVKRAYFAAAKRFHPDALGRLGLEDLKPQASEVFARMVKAYEVLSDPDRRREYDASLAGGAGGDDDAAAAARLVQAETLFRKGEILVRAGRFAEAVEFLRPAAELWPEDATYQATLGWALFRGRCGDKKEALVPLEQALALDPEHADAHYWMGAVLRALGRGEEADRLQARGRELARARGGRG